MPPSASIVGFVWGSVPRPSARLNKDVRYESLVLLENVSLKNTSYSVAVFFEIISTIWSFFAEFNNFLCNVSSKITMQGTLH